MKYLPSLAAACILATASLSTSLEAQMTRESARHLKRDTALPEQGSEPQVAPEDTTESAPAPVETPAAETVVVDAPVPEIIMTEPEVTEPTVDTTALQAEVARDPNSYQNENYSFEVTDKGVLSRIALADGTVLVDTAGAVNLQGSYVTAEGRRVWFYAGGVANATYLASSTKSVRDGAVVFDVSVKHPRFSMVSTYTCGEKSIAVDVKFTPIEMQDPRGDINALYGLQLAPACLTTTAEKPEASGATYTTTKGLLQIDYASGDWVSDDRVVAHSVQVGGMGVTFSFNAQTQPDAGGLYYTIKLP